MREKLVTTLEGARVPQGKGVYAFFDTTNCGTCKHFYEFADSRVGDCLSKASFAYLQTVANLDYCSYWEPRP